MKLFDAMPKTSQMKRLHCFITDSQELIREAQALRYRVFAGELGAMLKSADEQLDYDEFDAYCDHLIVFDAIDRKVVGYTRLLNDTQAAILGRFYSQTEFNLGSVFTLPGRFLEVGRTCIDPDYRGGAVLTLLWSGLARYAQEGHFDFLLGCASIPAGPNGFAVAAVYHNIAAKNFAPSYIKVTPKVSVPPELRCERDECGIPPLLKTYLRLGAWVCGEPCWDPQFDVMDLFILLPLDQIKDSYGKHYLKKSHSHDVCASAVV
ncbi:MAG: GNAT family N-acetyltransferase [Gammaproteobacteria bacterium]